MALHVGLEERLDLLVRVTDLVENDANTVFSAKLFSDFRADCAGCEHSEREDHVAQVDDGAEGARVAGGPREVVLVQVLGDVGAGLKFCDLRCRVLHEHVRALFGVAGDVRAVDDESVGVDRQEERGHVRFVVPQAGGDAGDEVHREDLLRGQALTGSGAREDAVASVIVELLDLLAGGHYVIIEADAEDHVVGAGLASLA